jgi:hypothetical protein
MCLWVSLKEKIVSFASLKNLKKGVGSGVESGSGSISQRYGCAESDPHQKVTDTQHWKWDGIYVFPLLNTEASR